MSELDIRREMNRIRDNIIESNNNFIRLQNTIIELMKVIEVLQGRVFELETESGEDD